MNQQNIRLFLGNLPAQATESDIYQRLQKFGNVTGVEIKRKKEVDNITVASTFAYVNIDANDSALNQCLQELRNKAWDGLYIKVELAKESFLQRLQRERSEAASKKTSENIRQIPSNKYFESAAFIDSKDVTTRKRRTSVKDDAAHSFKTLLDYNKKPYNTQIKKSSNSSPFVNDDHRDRNSKSTFGGDLSPSNEEENLISQFESFSDLWKDDIPVQSLRKEWQDNANRRSNSEKQQTPAGTFRKLQTVESDVNLVEKAGELKRLKALEERNKAVKQQKDAIKIALSSIDQVRPSKKIVFDDDGDPVTDHSKSKPSEVVPNKGNQFKNSSKGIILSKSSAGQFQLFDKYDDEEKDNWQGDFSYKKQFEGKKGKKLLEMQARFKDDERFVFDERFYESDNDDKEKTDKPKEVASLTEEEKELLEEKAKEMEILASVLGTPIQPSAPKKSTTFNPIVRFDPLKPSHAKFERPKPSDSKMSSNEANKIAKLGKSDGKDKSKDRGQVEEESLPKDEKQFYRISSNLRDLFRKNKPIQVEETNTFNLRQLFSTTSKGGDNENEEERSILEACNNETSPEKKRPVKKTILRGFQDSKPLAIFTKKLLRPEPNSNCNTFCKDVDVEAIKEKFSEKRRILGRMLHKKKVTLERQKHFKHKIGGAPGICNKVRNKFLSARRKQPGLRGKIHGRKY